jgi:AcrR family transcriptional regulator
MRAPHVINDVFCLVTVASPSPSRKARADGERNRARLLEIAKHAFAERGATASLEQIARDAGLAIGTLYRHFPTRDALIAAVYRQETDALVEAADRLPVDHPPFEALRAWLLLFVDFLAAKYGMADVLGTLIGGQDSLSANATERVTAALEKLSSEAAASGAIRWEIEPLDLLRAIGGVATLQAGVNWRASALRMVDLLLNGLRTTR